MASEAGTVSTWTKALRAGLIYGALAYACTAFSRFGAPVESIWLPNAFLIASLLGAQRQDWPVYLLAAAVGHLTAHLAVGDALGFSLGFLLADGAEVVLCATLFARRPGALAFRDRSGVFYFFAFSLLGALTSASVAAASSLLGGIDFSPAEFVIWMSADALALIVFLPLFTGFGSEHWRKLSSRPLRAIAAVAAVVALQLANIAWPQIAPLSRFILFPLLVFTAFELGVAGVVICLAALLAMWTALISVGALPTLATTLDPRSSMLLVQVFVGALAATFIPLAVALEERDRANEQLARLAREEIAKHEAEKANQFKSRLLATASHDLRQPLQAAQTYLSVLEGRLTTPDEKTIAYKAGRALDSMGNILEALLDVSRLDAGVIVPQFRHFDIGPVLERVVASNKPQAQLKGLEFAYAPVSLVVRSDPHLLERVIDNFVANAVRYTNAGRIELRCDVRDGAALISVTDTGIGIAPDALDVIFEDYVQLNNPERDRRKGLGLGLTIAARMASLLGHRLNVQSAVGEGSTFSVEVPLGATEASAAPHPAAAAAKPHGQLLVLFVDDDPGIADAISMAFEDAGIALRVARDGDAAIALIEGGARPDVLISDFRLPSGNGNDVIRRAREALGVDLPSAVLTGDTGLQGLKACPRCIVLHKPISTTDLIAAVRELASMPPVGTSTQTAAI